ncbi:monosaccharide ABC transporter membrane protein, CUT2 family [Rubellimicrobium thermophilum DSM 16684]|uniref:Monosaccharide ABC transporter membrane protein, CUT2 family n=1 Tax=Rubellimicrobium thermophilum DSM 16684 TaxID=1123069 RepID=S9SEY2_9RHOB|nr:ABC transporter permease [Rubellimicrobium thermophilum]EPX84849.1 monosaccharide ABC transporter membrane protein, CUT2 family [Rubellimicrobium thermophilum DSM 16684]
MTPTTQDRPSITLRTGRFLRDWPVVTLIILLLALVGLLELMRPGIVNERWIGNTVRIAIPLAMLAACQTMTMLTGSIDLSAGAVATISAFVVATQTPLLGPHAAIAIALLPAVLLGLLNGIGVGLFRVHPLIMTLATGLIGIGCLQVYQRGVIATGSVIPPLLEWLGTGRTAGLPHALLVFIPFAALLLWAERRSGFGRLLYAIGANEQAARLSGVRVWQVHLALYALSGLVAGLAGLLYVGFIKAPSLSLAMPLLLPSVAAAVIGGTSIFGGRGSFAGTIVGALILRVLETLLQLLRMPEGVRGILFGLIIILVTAIHVRLTGRD